MAYSVQFAPGAVRQLKSLSAGVQRKVITALEKESSGLQPEGEKQEKLRWINVANQRLLIMENHASQQLLVPKISGSAEILRRLHGEEPMQQAATLPDSKAVSSTSVQEVSAAGEDETESHNTAEQETVQERPAPSMLILKRTFLEKLLGEAGSHLTPGAPLYELKNWAREVAGSGGTYGYFEITQQARSILLGDTEDARLEAVASIIEIARRELAKL